MSYTPSRKQKRRETSEYMKPYPKIHIFGTVEETVKVETPSSRTVNPRVCLRGDVLRGQSTLAVFPYTDISEP